MVAFKHAEGTLPSHFHPDRPQSAPMDEAGAPPPSRQPLPLPAAPRRTRSVRAELFPGAAGAAAADELSPKPGPHRDRSPLAASRTCGAAAGGRASRQLLILPLGMAAIANCPATVRHVAAQ